MLQFLSGIMHKVGVGVMAVATTLGGIFGAPRVITITPQIKQLATIQEVIAPAQETKTELSATTTVASATSSSSTADVSTSAKKSAPEASKQAVAQEPKKITQATSTPVVKKVVAPPPAPKPAPPPPPAVIPQNITAQSLLDAATLIVKQRHDGTYALAFQTSLGNLSWDLSMATVGGNGSIPAFKPSFSCDPSPDLPSSNAIDQNPSFQMRSSYRCTVSLTALAGSDRSTKSKEFSFQTGGGQLTVSPAATINPVLKDGKNSGGFVFRNQDTEAVTVTSVKVDISYGALNISPIPPILRLVDATSDKTLAEYDLSTLPQDSSHEFSYQKNSVEMPLSFPLKAGQEKMLAVDVLAVQKIRTNGLDPNVNVTLRGATVDHGDIKLLLNSPKLSWMCIVPTSAYDPNATSGPFMTGQACRE